MPGKDIKQWENRPSTATPINADSLMDMEERDGEYAESLITGPIVRETLVIGNSHGEGDGNGIDKSMRMTRVACDILGSEEYNIARSGAQQRSHSDGGGWRAFFRRFKPINHDGTLRTGSDATFPNDVGHWLAPIQSAILVRHMNDLMSTGSTLNAETPVMETLRSEICRTRSAALWAMNDAGWSGTMAAASAETSATDGVWRNALTGTYIERTLPPHWPGAYIYFTTICGNGFGAQWTMSVNGSVVITSDQSSYTTLGGTGIMWPCTRRVFVPKTAAGQVVRITCTNAGVGAVLNWVGVETPYGMPICVVHGHKLPVSVQNIAYMNTTDAEINQHIARMKSIVDEFRGDDPLGRPMRITDYALDENTDRTDEKLWYCQDLLHASEYANTIHGTEIAKRLAYQASDWKERPRPTEGGSFRNSFISVSDVYGYSPATYQNGAIGLGIYGYVPSAEFQRDSQGYVRIRGMMRWATLNTTGFTLPPGHRPGYALYFPVVFNTNGFSGAWGTGLVSVNVDGAVTLVKTESITNATPPVVTQNAVGGTTAVYLNGINFKARS